MLKFVDVRDSDYEEFHNLLNDYYRDGADANTPQSEIDGFIRYLFDLCHEQKICGCIAREVNPVGFVLWSIDSADGAFSQKPGFGTILEIGVRGDSQGKGIGGLLVEYAQFRMNMDQYYVCAYGPAEAFWAKCGYSFSGETAENGLKIMIKGDHNGR